MLPVGQRRSSRHNIVITKERYNVGIFIWLVVVGIVGALIAGYAISPWVGVASINQNAPNIGSIIVSLVGAIILISIVKLVRAGVG